jgi:hypothetical protein
MAPPRQFIDPLGSKAPALETNLLRLRAMQMLLVLFYAEELKRAVLDSIRATDRIGKAIGSRSQDRVPQGIKKPVEKALAALVVDKAITISEKREIEALIDYRNAVGHQVHSLLADVASKGSIRERALGMAKLKKIPEYQDDAVDRLRHFLKRMNGLYRTHYYVRTFNFNGVMFHSAERVFLAEIKRLKSQVRRLSAVRVTAIKKLNAELSLKGTGLEHEWHPAGTWSRYGDGRLSRIGAEICYRLFDLGRSPLAVAHLTEISLAASRRRHHTWVKLGGRLRPAIELASLPRPTLWRDDD